MRHDDLANFWKSSDDEQRISMLKRMRGKQLSLTANQLGIDYPEGIQTLDKLAGIAELATVYVTVVDVAGMRDYEPGVVSQEFANWHRPRKSSYRSVTD